MVGVHDDLAAGVARRAPDHLDERPGRPQEALLVGVEDRHERHLGQVDALAQEVDADQHVVDAEPQVAQDRDPLERVDLAVEVLDLDAQLLEVVGQVLGHLLGQRRDERPLAALDAAADLLEQVVDLAVGRPDGDRRVDDAGRADELLDDVARAALELVRAGRRAHVDRLVDGAPRTPRTSAAGCPARTAAGTRSRRGSPCASGRSCTCRRPAGSSCATRRRRAASPAGSSRAASTAGSRPRAGEVARVVLDARSSSRARAASRGRTSCAGAAGRPRARGPRPRARRPGPPSRPRCRRSRP